MLTVNIGDMQEFKASQLRRVEQKKEEEKQIKKGIYQMQVLIDSQLGETFDKEVERSRERTEISRREAKKAENAQEASRELMRPQSKSDGTGIQSESRSADSRIQGDKNADLKQAMGRMMAIASPLIME